MSVRCIYGIAINVHSMTILLHLSKKQASPPYEEDEVDDEEADDDESWSCCEGNGCGGGVNLFGLLFP